MNQTPVINVLSLPFVNAHRSNVCGTYLDGLGSDHLEDTWIAQLASAGDGAVLTAEESQC